MSGSTIGGSGSGVPGPTGKSAYQSALDNGFVGTEAEWLASHDGEDGVGLAVNDVTELTSLSEGTLLDNDRVFVKSLGTDYFYDTTAISGEYAPDDQTGGTGFWLSHEQLVLKRSIADVFLSDTDPSRRTDQVVVLDGQGSNAGELKLVTLSNAAGKIPPGTISASGDLQESHLYEKHHHDTTSIAVTIQPNSVIPLPLGAWVAFAPTNGGEVDFLAGTVAVTLLTEVGYDLATGPDETACYLWQDPIDTWTLYGRKRPTS